MKERQPETKNGGSALTLTAAKLKTHLKRNSTMSLDENDTTINVNLPEELSKPIEWADQVVITTELLALSYGTDEDYIHKNFSRNEGRFEEGKHYFKLTHSNLRKFKNQPSFRGLVDKRASHLILWTARGAARHAKLLNTDQAWNIFEKLEDSYFEKQAQEQLPVKTDRESLRDARETFKDYHAIAKLLPIDKNQMLICANSATIRRTGFNLLDDMQIRIEAPSNDKPMIPTDLAPKIGAKSARAANLILQDNGLQKLERKSNGEAEWVLTEKGKQYARLFEVPLPHGEGKSKLQIMWYPSVIPLLTEQVAV